MWVTKKKKTRINDRNVIIFKVSVHLSSNNTDLNIKHWNFKHMWCNILVFQSSSCFMKTEKAVIKQPESSVFWSKL